MKTRRSIKTILMVFFGLSAAVIAVVTGAMAIVSLKQSSEQSIANYEAAMNDGYQTEIKSQVETAITVLQAEYDKAQAGEITESRAKEEAKEIIRAMRYREDASGYFWIDDTDYNLVMHPILSEQEGNNRYELEDQNGVMIIQEIMRTVNSSGGGFNEFYFTKSDGVTVAPKIAYSEIFTPWGWVVSTGNYVDDMQSEMQQTKDELQQMFTRLIVAVVVIDVVLLAVVLVLGRLFGNWLCNPIIQLSEAAREVSVGKIDLDLERSDGGTEITALQNCFCDMIDNFKSQAEVINQVSQGNLSLNVMAKSDEDAVGNALVKMLKDNNRMFKNIQKIAGQIYSGSEQIAQAGQSLAQGSTEQAGAIEEISASVAEIADKSRLNEDCVEEVSQIVSATGTNVADGNGRMRELVAAMQEITDASANIRKVIKVVSDIAFNTNILALNAAVEASRAGEQGKGFAVVAQEVRNLAASSAEASGQIEALISDSIQRIERGSALAHDTQAALDLISGSIERITELSRDVSALSKEQAAAVAQINDALDQVATVISTNSAASEQFAASSGELASLSGNLKKQLSVFQLRK